MALGVIGFMFMGLGVIGFMFMGLGVIGALFENIDIGGPSPRRGHRVAEGAMARGAGASGNSMAAEGSGASDLGGSGGAARGVEESRWADASAVRADANRGNAYAQLTLGDMYAQYFPAR